MLKTPLYLLSNPDQAPELLGLRWGLHPSLVLARHLCVHVVLDAQGVPRRQMAAFARLHAPGRVPWERFGAVLVCQGSTVHVWAWPQALLDDARQRLGTAHTNWRVLPESLLGQVPKTGAVRRTCLQGFEVLRFDQGVLVQAQWSAALSENPAQAGGAAVREDGQQPRSRVTQMAVWASGVQPLAQARGGVRFQWARIGQYGWAVAGWSAMALSGAYAGWQWQQARALESERAQVQASLEQHLQSATASTKATALSAQDLAFAREVQRQTQGTSLEELLGWLRGPLADKGLLLRELSVERDEVKLALVSGYGGAVDLDAAVSALEAAHRWRRLELVDTTNPALPKFALGLAGGEALGARP